MASVAVYQPALRAANAVISYAVYLAKTIWPSGLAAFPLHLDPSKAEVRHRLGVYLVRLRRLPEALDTLRAASRALPGSGDVWTDLGDAAFRFGLLAEAEAASQEALRLKPGDALVRWNLQQAQAGSAGRP